MLVFKNKKNSKKVDNIFKRKFMITIIIVFYLYLQITRTGLYILTGEVILAQKMQLQYIKVKFSLV